MSFNYYAPMKGWESRYDPKFYEKASSPTPKKWPEPSTLPENKWVKPRPPEKEDTQAKRDHRKEIRNWLAEQKIKYQICLVSIDKRECEVFLFKKTKHAMLFKLTWG